MVELIWDGTGQRLYETGVDHGVLYLADETGAYTSGYVWNGLTTVTESPSGAEASPQYADNQKYINLVSNEEFGATIEALTYPKEFALCDGSAEVQPGVFIGQQNRKTFGFSYRTLIGNDLEGTDYGYKLHLVYNALAAPSEKARATVNDTPEAMTMSWELTTTPAAVGTIGGVAYRPTSHLVIDSTEVDEDDLETLLGLLYGTEDTTAALPPPATVIGLFAPAGP